MCLTASSPDSYHESHLKRTIGFECKVVAYRLIESAVRTRFEDAKQMHIYSVKQCTNK